MITIMGITYFDSYWQDAESPLVFNYVEWSYRRVIIPEPYQGGPYGRH